MNTSRISPNQHRLRCRLLVQPLTRTRPGLVHVRPAPAGTLAPDQDHTHTLVLRSPAAVADGPTHDPSPHQPGDEATHTHLPAPAPVPLHQNLGPAAPSRTADPRADPCHEHPLGAAMLDHTTPVGITPARHLAQLHHHRDEGNAGTRTGVTPVRCLDLSHLLDNNNGPQDRKEDVTRRVSRRLLVVVVVGMILARLLRRVVVMVGEDIRTRCRGLLRRRAGVVDRLRLDRGGLVRLITFNGIVHER